MSLRMNRNCIQPSNQVTKNYQNYYGQKDPFFQRLLGKKKDINISNQRKDGGF